MLDRFRALWEAVLLQALADYTFDPTPAEIEAWKQNVRADAKDFIEDDRVKPGSFRWLCDMLGLEHTAVRRQVRASA